MDEFNRAHALRAEMHKHYKTLDNQTRVIQALDLATTWVPSDVDWVARGLQLRRIVAREVVETVERIVKLSGIEPKDIEVTTAGQEVRDDDLPF